MSRVTHGDVIARTMELVDIAISANTGDGSSVDALKGAQDYDARIVAWEIIDNAADFEVARAADMAAPKFTRDLDEGFAPPVSKFALPELFLRSKTGATVTALLILYLAKEDVL